MATATPAGRAARVGAGHPRGVTRLALEATGGPGVAAVTARELRTVADAILRSGSKSDPTFGIA